VGRRGLDSSGSGYGPVAGSCEHGNEPSGSIKVGEFLDYLNFYWLSRMTLLHVVIYIKVIDSGGFIIIISYAVRILLVRSYS
jgi:hypothetical protein